VSARPASAHSARASAHSGRRLGRVRLTPVRIVVALVLLGSLAYIAYVVAAIRDDQIPLLGAGFAALGLSFGAITVDALVGMWREASRAEGGRAFVLASIGGLAGLAAIGSFAITALSMLVWNS